LLRVFSLLLLDGYLTGILGGRCCGGEN